jgi:hypothetical protein
MKKTNNELKKQIADNLEKFKADILGRLMCVTNMDELTPVSGYIISITTFDAERKTDVITNNCCDIQITDLKGAHFVECLKKHIETIEEATSKVFLYGDLNNNEKQN